VSHSCVKYPALTGHDQDGRLGISCVSAVPSAKITPWSLPEALIFLPAYKTDEHLQLKLLKTDAICMFVGRRSVMGK
jgi:hypothetical protein